MINSKVLSIDIGNAYIKILEGKQVGNNIFIYNHMTIPTPENSYNNGKIIDKNKMKMELFNVIKVNKIKTKNVIFTIQSTLALSREMILPNAKSNELSEIIEYEIEQYLPIVLDDYVIQHKVLEEIKVETNKKLKVQVVAIPRTIVEMHLELVRDLKLKPLALDINFNSVSKLVNKGVKINDENYSFDKTIAFIDLGHSLINLNIIKEGKSLFSRSIHFKKNTNEWINEINRLLLFYMSREKILSIDAIYLYGGSSKFEGIREILSQQLNIPVYNIENISCIKFIKTTKDIEIANYLNATGAIIIR